MEVDLTDNNLRLSAKNIGLNHAILKSWKLNESEDQSENTQQLHRTKGDINQFPIVEKNNEYSEEINSFCTLNYQTTFPRFAKIKVNGKEAEPLFEWLKKEKSGPLGARIEWNFAKFLINREGQVVERFSSKTDPLKMEDTIKSLLNN